MIHSMTGYAALHGEGHGHRWSWELRSVNARGLDIRLRVPDWIEGLEAATRAALAQAAARGNISASLRVFALDSEGRATLNSAQLDTVLAALAETEARAMAAGLTLGPSTGAALLSLRGVLDYSSEDAETALLREAVLAGLPDLIAAFNEMRAGEGAALAAILTGQIDEIAALTEEAATLLAPRRARMAETLRQNLERLAETGVEADADRVAQEMALLVVKADVTEELDRLRAHVGAARDLIAAGGPVGRKLDFLTQEFNREANTLCSKAQMKELTDVGLSLKVAIDQMREQVQNVE